MRVLIIDNYDSFTYNLYQYVGESLSLRSPEPSFEVMTRRNNEVSLEEVKALNPDRIIISPGPGTPSDKAYFGVCAEVITQLGPYIPVLGVCLGMQGIAHCFGANIVRADTPVHGKTSVISHDEKGVYRAIPQELEVMRYHSLIVERESLPECFDITSVIVEGNVESFDAALQRHTEIMGVRHKMFPIEGIQYHPESFATEGGAQLLENFLFST